MLARAGLALFIFALSGCSLVYDGGEFLGAGLALESAQVNAGAAGELGAVLEGEHDAVILIRGESIAQDARVSVSFADPAFAHFDESLQVSPVLGVSGDGTMLGFAITVPVLEPCLGPNDPRFVEPCGALAEAESTELRVEVSQPTDGTLVADTITVPVAGLDELNLTGVVELSADDTADRYSRISLGLGSILQLTFAGASPVRLRATDRIESGIAVLLATGGAASPCGDLGRFDPGFRYGPTASAGGCEGLEASAAACPPPIESELDHLDVIAGSGGGGSPGMPGGGGGGAFGLDADRIQFRGTALLDASGAYACERPAKGGGGGAIWVRAFVMTFGNLGGTAFAAHGGGNAVAGPGGSHFSTGAVGFGGVVRIDLPRTLTTFEADGLQIPGNHPLALESPQVMQGVRHQLASGPLITAVPDGSSATQAVPVFGGEGADLVLTVNGEVQANFLGGSPANPFAELAPGANEVCVFTVADLDRSVPETHHCRTLLFLPPGSD